ncbi:MAG: diaminopimelate decarboxylase [Deltaproteobacteria bacterium RIFCSPLOWO2_02_FULL_50_16]|nr:MAG: diaminopimelate decarboxylase [Deltaproteobacteria bacterium RIFCSPHIGHO2_02_FULL_50_15]OGQ58039.1 MAG: diaminopimelate decarboxylase [Deltaproteobacteria bacterium RIFCSPLOWO2_02_FULL_50_16]
MTAFRYKRDSLYVEGIAVSSLAKKYKTPLYIYSHKTLTRQFDLFDAAFKGIPHLVCFAIKSNSNLSIVKTMADRGGGADIVSIGELYRARQAGVPAKKIVFSGVGKTHEEIQAALRADILMFNVESEQELEVLQKVAQKRGKKAPVALRVNPDIDAKTHPYIATGMKENKFGTPIHECLRMYNKAKNFSHLDIVGISCHIGSQITQTSPFTAAIHRLRILIEKLEKNGIFIQYLDLGGGLGITYSDETPPAPARYGAALKKALKGLRCTLILEPGRVLVGNAGIFVTEVIYTKKQGDKNFVIVDGAMNDLVRPSLYQAHHEILPVKKKRAPFKRVDVVGPICETGDFLAKGRRLPRFLPGELMAVMSAGAYGFSMASNYNSRPRTAEVLVQGGKSFLIRQRETLGDLVRHEAGSLYLLQHGLVKR